MDILDLIQTNVVSLLNALVTVIYVLALIKALRLKQGSRSRFYLVATLIRLLIKVCLNNHS